MKEIRREIENIIMLEDNDQDKIDQICQLVKERLEKIKMQPGQCIQLNFSPTKVDMQTLTAVSNDYDNRIDTLITELSGEKK